MTIEPLPLHHEGVVLRRLVPDDLPAFQAYRNLPEVGRFQGWSPMTDAQALAFLTDASTCPLFVPGDWVQIGIGLNDRPGLVGDIGIHVAPDQTEAELGFTLAPHAQGKGVATAAVRAALQLVFAHTGVARVVAITDIRNLPSVRLLQRVGMRLLFTQQTVFRGAPCTEAVYVLQR